jgi:hypothetical protein
LSLNDVAAFLRGFFMGADGKKKHGEQADGLGPWILVCGLALLFLLYGLFMFIAFGDKGPPGWDFSVVEDTPGKSVFSTFPEPGGTALEPHQQHVAGKPIQAPAERGEIGK